MLNQLNQLWPGMAFGLTPEQVQQFTRAQYIAKTVYFTTSTTAQVTTNVELTGSAVLLLGVRSDIRVTSDDSIEHYFTLQINNAFVFQDLPQSNLSLREGGSALPFVPFPRYITGSRGNIILYANTISGGAQQRESMTFFYLSNN